MKTLVDCGVATVFALVGACAGCAAETDAGAHRHAALLPTLVSQRVNAVVQRQSQQLLYLETEHQSIVTTPEHPFATVESGWVPARELAPGDRVISAKFGSLRVLSARIETRAQPVPVFNLTVDRSHAYWVGSADVLVHNTGCRGPEDTVTRKTREVEEATRQLDALKNDPATSSSEQPHERKKRIEELETNLKKLKKQLSAAKYTAKVRENGKAPQREDKFARNSREMEETKRELDALESTVPTSREEALALKEKIAGLKSKLKTLSSRLRAAKHRERRQWDPALINAERPQILRGEDLRNELAAAQAELAELQRQRTESGAPAAARGPRETELEKIIREHTYDLKKEDELAELQDKLAKLEESVPTSHEPRPDLESEKQQLKKLIEKNRQASYARRSKRKRLEDSDAAAEVLKYEREWKKRSQRRPNYVNDPNRPRDAVDQLEQELAELEALPSSPSRDWRVSHTQARLERLKRQAELRRQIHRVVVASYRARKDREGRIQAGQDTKAVDDKLAALDGEYKKLAQQMAVERARDILDGVDEGQHAPPSVGDTAPFDQEFLDQLLHEIENEQAARHGQLEQNTLDVDEELRLINDLLANVPSPPPEEVHAAVARLRSDLHNERAQFERNQFSLTNEYAYLNATLGPGNPAAARRMAEIQAQIRELGVTWQNSTQQRLDETRGLLHAMQRTPRFRDETTEAVLAQQIALLEQELAHPPF